VRVRLDGHLVAVAAQYRQLPLEEGAFGRRQGFEVLAQHRKEAFRKQLRARETIEQLLPRPSHELAERLIALNQIAATDFRERETSDRGHADVIEVFRRSQREQLEVVLSLHLQADHLLLLV